jgi:hypothetical protein
MDILQACAGLEGMAQWNRDLVCVYPRHGRPWGCGPAEQRLCKLVQALEAWTSRDSAGLEGPTQWNGDCVCVSLVWQTLGMWPGRAEMVQGCAGLGGCGLAEMVNVCGSLALRAYPTEIMQF